MRYETKLNICAQLPAVSKSQTLNPHLYPVHTREQICAFLNGKDSRFDITIVSVTNYPSKFGPHGPNIVPLKAAVSKCNAKYAKHGKIHNDNLIPFWPLALESNGAMHSYLRHLISFAADHADKDNPPDANWSTPTPLL